MTSPLTGSPSLVSHPGYPFPVSVAHLTHLYGQNRLQDRAIERLFSQDNWLSARLQTNPDIAIVDTVDEHWAFDSIDPAVDQFVLVVDEMQTRVREIRADPLTQLLVAFFNEEQTVKDCLVRLVDFFDLTSEPAQAAYELLITNRLKSLLYQRILRVNLPQQLANHLLSV